MANKKTQRASSIEKKSSITEHNATDYCPFVVIEGMYYNVSGRTLGKPSDVANVETGEINQIRKVLAGFHYLDSARPIKFFKDKEERYMELSTAGFHLLFYIANNLLKEGCWWFALNIKGTKEALFYSTPRPVYLGILDLLNAGYIAKKSGKKGDSEFWINGNLFFSGNRHIALNDEDNKDMEAAKLALRVKAGFGEVEKKGNVPNTNFENEKA
tara:strand:- start:690 stop:1331 length:642 start_codon:yes stop_codon:yes gene_type:complete